MKMKIKFNNTLIVRVMFTIILLPMMIMAMFFLLNYAMPDNGALMYATVGGGMLFLISLVRLNKIIDEDDNEF